MDDEKSFIPRLQVASGDVTNLEFRHERRHRVRHL